ncbi:MAG: PspC domain-containing protein [Bacteroidota bacterium]
MEPRKLRRSYKDSVIGGVAGGLGEYFATDPLIFRILFVVLLFTGGGGFLIYILMWIFIPKNQPKFEDHFNEAAPEKEIKPIKVKSNNSSLIGGSILIFIGLFFLLDNFWPWLDFSDLWPIALVIAGLAIVKMNYKPKKNDTESDESQPFVEQ